MSAFKCPKCGEMTGGNEKFCIECGQPLNITCPECGEGWRFIFDYKFCPLCGHNMKKAGENKPLPGKKKPLPGKKKPLPGKKINSKEGENE